MKIKNWEEFQHFKDRTPPWIKLYRYLLDDPEWHKLSGDDAKVLTMLWLVASEDKAMQGNLPNAETLAFRLRIAESKLNQSLNKLKHWVILDDIKAISRFYQDDAPETETETETETEKIYVAKKLDFFAGLSEQLISDYKAVRKAKRAPPVNQTVYNGLKREADKANITIEQALTVCVERNWVGFKSEWYQDSLVSKKVDDLSWRNDESQIMKIANELQIHTQGKSKYEILAKIDAKRKPS
jgi:hypothetical protein